MNETEIRLLLEIIVRIIQYTPISIDIETSLPATEKDKTLLAIHNLCMSALDYIAY